MTKDNLTLKKFIKDENAFQKLFEYYSGVFSPSDSCEVSLPGMGS